MCDCRCTAALVLHAAILAFRSVRLATSKAIDAVVFVEDLHTQL